MAILSKRDTEAYLAEPHVAMWATVRPDGRPHLAPVYFKWEGATAYVTCSGTAAKVRNIEHNPAVTLCVANAERPFKYVLLEGLGELMEDGIEEIAHRLFIHYEGPEEWAAIAQRLLSSHEMVVILIRVARITGWTDG